MDICGGVSNQRQPYNGLDPIPPVVVPGSLFGDNLTDVYKVAFSQLLPVFRVDGGDPLGLRSVREVTLTTDRRH